MLRVLGRVVLDQLMGSPTVIWLVFTSNAIIHGDSLELYWHRLVHQGPQAWKAGLQFWPFVHTINFGFVPLKHQALVAHVGSLYWNFILSYYSYVPEADKDGNSGGDADSVNILMRASGD